MTFPKLPGAPLRALRGFTRVHVPFSKTQHVRLALQPRDLSYVSQDARILISPGSYTLSIGGGQPGTSAAVQEIGFVIDGEKQLPE